MSDETTVNDNVDNPTEPESTSVPISRLNKEIDKRKALEDQMIDMQDKFKRFEQHNDTTLEEKGDFSTLYNKTNQKNLDLTERNAKLQDELIRHTEREGVRRDSLLEKLPDDLKSFGVDMEVDKLQDFVDKQKKFNMNMPRPSADSPRPSYYKDNVDWIKKDPNGYLKARKEGRLSFDE